jgi:hypothetical protein
MHPKQNSIISSLWSLGYVPSWYGNFYNGSSPFIKDQVGSFLFVLPFPLLSGALLALPLREETTQWHVVCFVLLFFESISINTNMWIVNKIC